MCVVVNGLEFVFFFYKYFKVSFFLTKEGKFQKLKFIPFSAKYRNGFFASIFWCILHEVPSLKTKKKQ